MGDDRIAIDDRIFDLDVFIDQGTWHDDGIFNDRASLDHDITSDDAVNDGTFVLTTFTD